MTTNPPRATVLGFAYDSPVTEFPVRSGPGTTSERAAFKAQKDWADLPVLDVQPDSQGTPNDVDPSRVYQWFKLQFPNGETGWMRGHVIGLVGDCRDWGYPVLDQATHAYTLVRDESKTGPAPLEPGQEILPYIDTGETETASAAGSLIEAAAQAEVTDAPSPTEEAGSPVDTDSSAAVTEAPETASSLVDAATSASVTDVETPSTTPVSPVETEAAARQAELGMGEPTAIIKVKTQARLRTGPSTNFGEAGYLDRHAEATIIGVERESVQQRYRWFNLSHQGRTSWIREDLVTYKGATADLGLPDDLYPSPMATDYWWVRGYNVPPHNDPNTYNHNGWDQGAETGEPMYCGPHGGLVVESFECKRCTPDRPSTLSQGYSLGDSSVFSDPGWGWGYGNFIIVRYLHNQLPASTQQALAQAGYPGGHLFVMHAHLKDRRVEIGDTLTGGQQIATCGNTGNSEATHLHLEVRASKSADFTRWAYIQNGLMDPVVLFRR